MMKYHLTISLSHKCKIKIKSPELLLHWDLKKIHTSEGSLPKY